jgi:hypothetical protein
MGNSQGWDDIVGDLYDAVLQKEPSALNAAITSFELQIDSDGCHLFGVSTTGQELFTVVTYPNDVSTDTSAYYSHYIHIDPRVDLTRKLPGQANRSADFFNASYVSRSEFFQDYLLPLGRHHITGGLLLKAASKEGQISVLQSLRPFSATFRTCSAQSPWP